MPSNRPQPRRSANRRPTPPAARTRSPRPTGQRRPAAQPTAPAGLRGGLERASLPVLTKLTSLPRWLVGLVPGVLLLGGLLAPPPWGTVLLGLVTLFLVWLLVLSWPRLDGRSRAIRTFVILLLVAATAAHGAGVI
ncbi:MAG TPA: DUF6703 family protein [Jiangellaceae bacterium]|nr:DUF6703 family protein [Jiangellaceae bacterium]